MSMAETLPIRLTEVNGHLEDAEGNKIERSELIVKLRIKNDGLDPEGKRLVLTDEKAIEQAKQHGVKYYSKDAFGSYTLYMPR